MDSGPFERVARQTTDRPVTNKKIGEVRGWSLTYGSTTGRLHVACEKIGAAFARLHRMLCQRRFCARTALGEGGDAPTTIPYGHGGESTASPVANQSSPATMVSGTGTPLRLSERMT